MGSQDQHRETEPQTAADALARAAELRDRADAADRTAGHYASHELREEASHLTQRARQLAREERREKSRQDAAAIDAMVSRRRSERGFGGDAA
ncbi:hypothetical protein [Streptomyces sp. NRRL F-5527]|uniref:hypothetical protein n=1 Tax=Streptomyces TaxID=1883 RepID=UPI0004C87075|nr:hypothetical protein [Streptomyces sp. NRRL F-5527]